MSESNNAEVEITNKADNADNADKQQPQHTDKIMHNVLDCVLENIDGILMDNIPPNPVSSNNASNNTLPPIPSIQDSVPSQYQGSSPNTPRRQRQQFYLQQSVNNNNIIMMMNNNNNHNNNNKMSYIDDDGHNDDSKLQWNGNEKKNVSNLLIGPGQHKQNLLREHGQHGIMTVVSHNDGQLRGSENQIINHLDLPSMPVIPQSIFNDPRPKGVYDDNEELKNELVFTQNNSCNLQLREIEQVINKQYHLAQQIHRNFAMTERENTGLLNKCHGVPTQHRSSFISPCSSYNSLVSLTSNQSASPSSTNRSFVSNHSFHSNISNRSSNNSAHNEPLINNINHHQNVPNLDGNPSMNMMNNDENGNNEETNNDETDNIVNINNDDNRGGTNNNNNNILFNGFSTKIVLFGPDEKRETARLQLKDYVFISKDCTSRLSQYIVKEAWGKDYGLLYKYLDYIFRCQAFKKQIIIINNKYLIFHCGLQRRTDKQFLYCLLVPNKKYVAQKWRVQFGNIKNSFVSKAELLSKLPESYLIVDYLPKRTRFYTLLSDLLYDETYSIEVNWEERLTTNKDRICRVLGNLAFFDSNTKFMKLTELIEAFDTSLNQTKRIAQLNPRLAVPQGFIDTKNSKFRMELLLPIILEFPKHSSSFYIFALAIGKSMENDKKYTVKSILTMEMAYANARLVGYVDSSWLKYGANNHKRTDINDFFCKK